MSMTTAFFRTVILYFLIMTGLRLMISGYYELKRRNARYGCGSLCAGGGPAMAVVFERLV